MASGFKPSPNVTRGNTQASGSTHQFTGSVTIDGSLAVNGVNITGGGGDVTGPGSSTDHAIARYNLTTGKIIQDSGITIDDLNNINGVESLEASMMSTTILTETINTDTEADCSSYNIFKYTIDATLDITGSNPVAGASYLFILTQGPGAPYTVAWDGFKWPNGGTLPVLSLVAGEIDVVSGISDGTYIYADITKNFS
jgi:hypothetical protein